MKCYKTGFICLVFFASVLLIANIASALPPLDYGDIMAPKFKNVDVVLETEWNMTERTNEVNVVEIKDKDKIFGITMVRQYQTLSEVTLVKGITIKIFDHETGKLLHTYKFEAS